MSTQTTTARAVHRPAGTGDRYWGPGDVYRFLITGAETGGAYFVMEAIVPPGGGPPPHVHRDEDESFYVVEGECSLLVGDEWTTVRTGDYVSVPRGTVHAFHNPGDAPMRMILTFTPAGMEDFFLDTLEPVLDPTLAPPPPEAVAARYVEAAPRHGIEFVQALTGDRRRR